MWFSAKGLRDRVELHPKYRQALHAARDYKARENVDYDWVVRHSTEEYELIKASVTALDSKAHGLIGYLGAGSGLISLVFSGATARGDWLSMIHIFPALILLLMAIFCAAKARAPMEIPLPPNTQTALSFADAYPVGVAAANFSAMTGVATTAMIVVAEEKGRLVRRAFGYFISAVAWLVVLSPVPLGQRLLSLAR